MDSGPLYVFAVASLILAIVGFIGLFVLFRVFFANFIPIPLPSPPNQPSSSLTITYIIFLLRCIYYTRYLLSLYIKILYIESMGIYPVVFSTCMDCTTFLPRRWSCECLLFYCSKRKLHDLVYFPGWGESCH